MLRLPLLPASRGQAGQRLHQLRQHPRVNVYAADKCQNSSYRSKIGPYLLGIFVAARLESATVFSLYYGGSDSEAR